MEGILNTLGNSVTFGLWGALTGQSAPGLMPGLGDFGLGNAISSANSGL